MTKEDKSLSDIMQSQCNNCDIDCTVDSIMAKNSNCYLVNKLLKLNAKRFNKSHLKVLNRNFIRG